MDLSDLSIFRAVVREGSVTRAAESLHRVQSNVTTRIRQLEEDLRVTLFIREGKRLHLTLTVIYLADDPTEGIDLFFRQATCGSSGTRSAARPAG